MTAILLMGIGCLIVSLIAWAPALVRMWKRLRTPPPPSELWMAGEYQGRTKGGLVIWELIGVFTARELALASCNKKNHFITRLELDQPLPDKPEDGPVTEYPLITGATNVV